MRTLYAVSLATILATTPVFGEAIRPDTSKVSGDFELSNNHVGVLNFSSCQRDAIEQTLQTGTITYIGLEKREEDTEVNTAVALGGSGVIAGGDSTAIVNGKKRGVVIKVKTANDLHERLLYVRERTANDPPGTVLLDMYNAGDRITFPALRAYDSPGCLYRVLERVDVFSPKEISPAETERRWRPTPEEPPKRK